MANLKGLGLFVLQVTSLISQGKKETISDIEKHINDCDLVDYIYKKYKDMIAINFDNTICDNKALSTYFHNYSGYIDGNESRKYGIINEDDGLLLIISLVTDKIESECIGWDIEV